MITIPSGVLLLTSYKHTFAAVYIRLAHCGENKRPPARNDS
jgi:hypothetical protein